MHLRMSSIALLTLMAGTACTKSAQRAAPKADAVKVEFFVMSQCPYGVQVETGVKEALDKLGSDVDFKLDFIGNTGPNGEFSSLHGPSEVAGNIAQLCVAKHSPQALVDVVTCQNKNNAEVAKNWEPCATEAKANVAAIRTCIEGQEGKTLLTESFARAAARQATGSPTMFIGGKPYNGRRGSNDFLRAICAEYSAKKPAACASIPESPKVAVTIIGDKRCAECDLGQWVGIVQSRVGNPVITQLDYSAPEAKAILTETSTTMLPVVLFDESIKADKDATEAFSRWLRPAGKYQTLAIGASYMPACADEGGCKLDACKNTIACRAESKKKLELFVMSQCPYGVQALNSMKEVLTNLKGIDFSVNFIAQGSAASGFQSLHGQPEVDENIRELCAAKYYGNGHKYMDYILCRNKEIQSNDWKKCATAGIDAKVIEKCSTGGEGKKLLEENIKVANNLGIGASPTWVANGRHKFSGIDANSIKSNFCSHNPGYAGCDKTLSTSTGGVPAGGGCN